ncbi:MAG: hypothetical protein LBV23_11375 [Deltaproteobacteria bacterium]|nr:hypothetical protein [Deltaproteobacteria bacterium]
MFTFVNGHNSLAAQSDLQRRILNMSLTSFKTSFVTIANPFEGWSWWFSFSGPWLLGLAL